jgi:hypothetical protein
VDRGVDEAVKKLSEELKSNPGKFNKPNKPEKGSPKPPPPKVRCLSYPSLFLSLLLYHAFRSTLVQKHKAKKK